MVKNGVFFGKDRYSVGLPDETISLALMTDADIAGAEVRRYNNRGAMLAALLSNAPHTFERLRGDLDVLIHANVVSANTYLNLSSDHDGVISIGDAVSAIDPLAGQGSYVALESSTSIAATVAAYNRGSLTALEEHSRSASGLASNAMRPNGLLTIASKSAGLVFRSGLVVGLHADFLHA